MKSSKSIMGLKTKAHLSICYSIYLTETAASKDFGIFVVNLIRTIDFREFVLALQVFSKPSLDDAIDLTFRCIDLNNDGSITKGSSNSFLLHKQLNLKKL